MKASLVAVVAGLAASACAHSKGEHVEMLKQRMEMIIRDNNANVNKHGQDQLIEARQLGLSLSLPGTDTGRTKIAPDQSSSVASVAPVSTPPGGDQLLTTPQAATTTTPAAQVIQQTTSAAPTTTPVAVVVVDTTTSISSTTRARTTVSETVAATTTSLSDLLSSVPDATQTTVSASSTASAASSNEKESSGGIPKGVLIPLIVAASCAAAIAAIWTIVRKTKFSPSRRFEARMAPIKFDDDKRQDDTYGMLAHAHGRSASQNTWGSNGNNGRQPYAGYADELNRANSTSKASLNSLPLVDGPYQASPPRAYQGNGGNLAMSGYAVDSLYAQQGSYAGSNAGGGVARSNTQRSNFYDYDQHQSSPYGGASAGYGHGGPPTYSSPSRRY